MTAPAGEDGARRTEPASATVGAPVDDSMSAPVGALVSAPAGYPSALHGPAQMRAYRRAPLVGRWSPASARAAWWTWWALRRATRDLRASGVRASVAAPPALAPGARRGVELVLRRTSPTCLERCLVLQTWLAAHDVPCEVVVGVARDADGVRAHAWLDVERDDVVARGYQEIHRLAPA